MKIKLAKKLQNRKTNMIRRRLKLNLQILSGEAKKWFHIFARCYLNDMIVVQKERALPTEADGTDFLLINPSGWSTVSEDDQVLKRWAALENINIQDFQKYVDLHEP